VRGGHAYRQGDTGPVVLEIRGKLQRLGLLDPAGPREATVFDAAVDEAVRAFQQQRGITVDGVVGSETYRVLEEARWRLGERILSHTVSHPMTGDDVAALQRRLLDMGFDAGRVDGVLGARTDAALRDFQRNVGVRPDGTCGPSTLKALARLTRTVVGGRPDALREETALARSGPALSGKVVVVDPGHGGTDRGVVAHGLDEASVVEDLAARIEGRLTATGVLAFLTRGTDAGLDDVDRAGFANTAEADLLISLHVDAAASPRACGVATYYYGNDRHGHSSAVGEKFAELVQREIVARTDLVDCRAHGKTWDLLRRTRMPAVRIELGYLTHPGDAARLAEPGFRDVVAEAVVVAVGRLYLPPDDDAPTGTLRLPELARR
jgi:N-acetylmuramoyl-L-alanine amidase